MDRYLDLISSDVLDGYERMIKHLPQPQMFGSQYNNKLTGGTRFREYVLPFSNESDYPATLSVGRNDDVKPTTLGQQFWRDFGKGYDPDLAEGIENPPVVQGDNLQGGKMTKFSKGLKPVADAFGGKIKIPKALKSVAKAVGKEVVSEAKSVGKKALKKGLESALSAPAPAPAGGKLKIPKALKSVAKAVGKEVVSEAKSVGKKALKKGLESALSAPADAPVGGLIPKGARANPERPMLPPDLKQKSSIRSAVGKGRQPSARGQLISKLMKEKGMSLGQASKYIKENGLY